MDTRLEQRANIKFCVKLRKSATETFEMLQQAYGDDAMSRARCFEWHSRFKNGRTSLEDDERSGRPSTSTSPEIVHEVERIVQEDRRTTISELADQLQVSFGSVQSILTSSLGMHRVAAKFVPRLLTHDQKQFRIEICQDLLQQSHADPTFLSRLITGDETWVYGYDPETKQQSSQWKRPSSPRPRKARQVRSATKSMMIVFFDIKGIVHREFLPKGQTVNAEFYCTVLKRLREDIRRKRPSLWRDGNWVLHHDNAPAHNAFHTREFLSQTGTTVAPHPPYSPDLAPCDFFLFPKLKMRLKGRRFNTVEEIQCESQMLLNTIHESDFHSAFQALQNRWARCIDAQGDYFEGDSH